MPTKGRRPESASSESEVAVSDIISVSDVEKIVQKAVKAAITVITQEFHQKVQDLKDYVKHLVWRIALTSWSQLNRHSQMSLTSLERLML